MGRDGVTTFGADDTVSTRILYDNNLDGVFETETLSAATTGAVAAAQFDPDLHQPYLDEFVVGFRKQFGWQIGLDVGYINRVYKDMWANVDINGYWPSAPGQPFGGFGRVDPNQGQILQQTNNTWSTLKYQAIEVTVTKNMSHGFQFMAGINRQWHKMDGTWNPTDRAAYLQPNHFANDANLYMPRGNNDAELAARHRQRAQLRPDVDEVPRELQRRVARPVWHQRRGQPDGAGGALVGLAALPVGRQRSPDHGLRAGDVQAAERDDGQPTRSPPAIATSSATAARGSSRHRPSPRWA